MPKAPPAVDVEADLAELGDVSGDMRTLEGRIAELADRRRVVIERLRGAGVSVARIAERMGVSTAAVHATLRRGK